MLFMVIERFRDNDMVPDLSEGSGPGARIA
jgi:hypothetical protein